MAIFTFTFIAHLATAGVSSAAYRPTQARYHCSPSWPPNTRDGGGGTTPFLLNGPSTSTQATPAFSQRRRAGLDEHPSDCDATFCVGPPTCYPTTVSSGLVWEASFDVPPLPKTFDPTSMTDYIYFNIVFGYGQPHDNPQYPGCSPFCRSPCNLLAPLPVLKLDFQLK